MHIISLLFFQGLVSGSKVGSSLQPSESEKQEALPVYLTAVHVAIMDDFIKRHCGGKVESATTVWNSVSNIYFKRVLLNGAHNRRSQTPEINQFYCKLFAYLEARSKQIDIATKVSELNPIPDLMKGNRYPPVEKYISDKCTGVQLPNPMMPQLKLAISSFSVSNPDMTSIESFCQFLGGIPKAD